MGLEALTISEVPAPVPLAPTKFSSAFTPPESTAPTPRSAADSTRCPPARAPIYGLEVAGVVEAVGEGASVENRGTPVMALLAGGGYADYVTVPVDHVLPVPEQLSFAEAAGIPESRQPSTRTWCSPAV